jgi:hypothetical protein
LPVRFPRSVCPPLRPWQDAPAPVSRNQGSQNSGSTLRIWLQVLFETKQQLSNWNGKPNPQDLVNLTAVLVKNTVIWDVPPCSVVDIYKNTVLQFSKSSEMSADYTVLRLEGQLDLPSSWHPQTAAVYDGT